MVVAAATERPNDLAKQSSSSTLIVQISSRHKVPASTTLMHDIYSASPCAGTEATVSPVFGDSPSIIRLTKLTQAFALWHGVAELDDDVETLLFLVEYLVMIHAEFQQAAAAP